MNESCNTMELVGKLELNSKLNSMNAMLDSLNSSGYTDSHIERALDFQRGQLKLWREGSVNLEPVDYALFRILCTHPRLIELAESGYDLNKFMIKIVRNSNIG